MATEGESDMTGGYVSPYGQPSGLSGRLTAWVDRMGKDRSLPWAGLGVLEDMTLAAKFLNCREFLEQLYANGDAEQADFARQLLSDLDTLEAVDDAASRVNGLPPGGPQIHDPVAVIEALDGEAVWVRREYESIRDVLIDAGALAPGDNETPLVDLVRLLLP